MADTANTHDERTDPDAEQGRDPFHPLLDVTLFTPEEFAALQELREQIAQGRKGELLGDYKRLLFVRWLYQQGKLTD